MFDGLLLSGTSTVSLDAKGRFLIPARYRQALLDQNEGTCVVTRSLFDKSTNSALVNGSCSTKYFS